ncbi:tetratricopeptide repeat protein [Isosphaera pallida]|nr:tetratricopeptide repeat protein [Isosphaera pallida]
MMTRRGFDSRDAFYLLPPDRVRGEFISPKRWWLTAFLIALAWMVNVAQGPLQAQEASHAIPPALMDEPRLDSTDSSSQPVEQENNAGKTRESPPAARLDLDPDPVGQVRGSALPRNLEQPPEPFVPAHPLDAEGRARLDRLADFAAARARELNRDNLAAIRLYRKLLETAPRSTAVLRRLSRINLVLGRINEAVEYSRRAVELDPNDSESLQLVVLFLQRAGQLDEARTLLETVLAAPALRQDSASALLAARELGFLYVLQPERIHEGASLIARVVRALDDKAAGNLSRAELSRVLGNPPQTYLRFGETLLNANRPNEAALAFERGLVYAPNDSALVTGLARARLRQDRAAEALRLVEGLIAQPNVVKFPETYRLQSEALEALGRGNEALARLEALAKASPRDVAIQAALADRLAREGRDQEALAILTGLINGPIDPPALITLTDLLIKAERVTDLLKIVGDLLARPNGVIAAQPLLARIVATPEFARLFLRQGIEGLSAEPPTLPESCRVALASIARQLNDLELQLQLDRLELKRNPNRQTYLQLFFGLVEAGRHGDAAETLSEMIAKFPESREPRIVVTLAQTRLRAGDKPGAIQAARDANALAGGDWETRRFAALVLSQAGVEDEAIELGRALLADAPNEPLVRLTLFSILMRAKRHEDALALARASLELDPANPDYPSMVGEALEALKQTDDAIEFYRSILDKADIATNPELELTIGQRLSGLLVKLGRIKSGQEVLETLFKKYPDDAGLNNDLGYLYADQGINLEQAETMIRKALEEEPDNPAYLDSLGWVLYKRGKVEESIPLLEKAIAKYPIVGGSATLQDHLGDAYLQLRNYAKARQAWLNAIEAAKRTDPPDVRLADLEAKLKLLDKIESENVSVSPDKPPPSR